MATHKTCFVLVAATLAGCAGLLTLHRAGADPRPAILKIAGIVLLLSGAGTAGCTAYYYFKYHSAGDLERPYPVSAAGMSMMTGKGGRTGMKRPLHDFSGHANAN